MGLVADLLGQRRDQLALTAAHFLRNFDDDCHELIAFSVTTIDRNSFASKPEYLSGLGARRDLHHYFAVECGHIDACAEHRLGEREGNRDQDVGALPLKELVVGNLDVDVKVAVAAWTGFASPPHGTHCAILNAGGNLHAHRFGAHLTAGAFAHIARRRDILAGAANIVLISAYTKSVLKSNLQTFIILGILVLLYGYLFVVLQLQDYALLMGSVGLFIVLATLMYLTRKIDWFSILKTSGSVKNNKQ